MNEIKIIKRKKKYISQKCFPTFKLIDEIPTILDSMEDNSTKRLIQLALCTGLRIGEILNGYWFKDAGHMTFRAVAEKKKKVVIGDYYIDANGKKRRERHKEPLHVMGRDTETKGIRGFQGEPYLLARLDEDIWTSRIMRDDFKLNKPNGEDPKHSGLGWIVENQSESIDEPHFMFKYHYDYYYKKLMKELPGLEVLYFKNRELEVPSTVQGALPSYHFFRKMMASKLVEVLDNPFDVVNFMHWGNVNQVRFYYKLYREKNFKEASNLFFETSKGWD